MKIQKSSKTARAACPWKCIDTEPGRYSVLGVLVKDAPEHPGYVRCEATDGRKLVSVLIEADENDKPGEKGVIVPGEAFEQAHKLASRAFPSHLTVNGSIDLRTMDGMTATFPAVERTFPDTESVTPKDDPKVKFALNVRHLVALADALGCDILDMEIRDPNQVVKVTPSYVDGHGGNASREGSFGLIMPVSTS